MIDENVLKNDLFINVHKERFQNYKTGEKGIYYLQKDVFDCIDRQKKISGWIPCNDRLPDTRNNILICLCNGYRTVGYYCQGKFFDLGSYPIDDVVAWQPLPDEYHE